MVQMIEVYGSDREGVVPVFARATGDEPECFTSLDQVHDDPVHADCVEASGEGVVGVGRRLIRHLPQRGGALWLVAIRRL
jgi:hypothetical protein